ncbi:hypothetical protein C1J03_18180 [Sulfitobacter sp. SK012]|uniref:sulfite exporter TauE/SafE family protein n=1 Tax=Sulfitobacter sp. SK012 TaxID=1389005 RepID=UPI000E0AEAE7|nr:sulfite exporter TauE/SafE family protein [Sulfitobacter sp. SK012]AXI47764.1 hypothetical protein C1J03_18180 [Sulfitobacter sp. SK012]
MLTLDWTFFAVAVPAVIFAGISKGGFGSGASFASATILALIIEPGMALGIMLPLLLLIDLSALGPFWGKWGRREAVLLIAGGLPGVALGALVYQLATPDLLRLLIGGVSLGFVFWRFALKRGWIRIATGTMPDWVGGLMGVSAGFTSFVSHAGGPLAAIYLLSRNLNKTEYQATTVVVFLIINIAKFVPYTFLGIFSAQTILADLVLAPFAVLGAWIGVRAHFLVPERLFFGLTYQLLIITGCKLIWDGLT